MGAIEGSRITIVTQYYWPEHVGIAPYSTGLAEHLAALGAHVDVVTAMPHYPSWRIDDDRYRTLRLDEEHRGVTVHRLWHYIPRTQSAARRAGYEVSLFAHALLRPAPPSDAVVGVIPSLSAGAVARVYSRRRSCPYGLVVQDLPAEGARQSGITKADTVGAATQMLERWVMAGATRVAVVTERFKPYVEAAGVAASRIGVLRNWVEVGGTALEPPSAEEARRLRRSLGWRDEESVVLHAGNMGLKQGLEFVVAAARRAHPRGLPVRFVLMGDGSQRPAIEDAAADLPNVQIIPSRPRDESNRIMAVADVLLVNERSTIVDMALPSKLTSYFVAGRPVLAAVTDEGTTAQEIRRANGGLVVPPENPEALIEGVLTLTSDVELASRLATNAVSYARSELSAERVLREAETFVAALLAEK